MASVPHYDGIGTRRTCQICRYCDNVALVPTYAKLPKP